MLISIHAYIAFEKKTINKNIVHMFIIIISYFEPKQLINCRI